MNDPLRHHCRCTMDGHAGLRGRRLADMRGFRCKRCRGLITHETYQAAGAQVPEQPRGIDLYIIAQAARREGLKPSAWLRRHRHDGAASGRNPAG